MIILRYLSSYRQLSKFIPFANGNSTIVNPSSLWTSLTVTVPATSTYTGAFGDLFFGVQLNDPAKIMALN